MFITEQNAFIWGAYSGFKAHDKLNGFKKEFPEIYDIGPKGVSAFMLRALQLSQYAKAKQPSVDCGWVELEDIGIDYIQLGCYSKEQVKTYGKQFHPWGKSVLDD